MELRYKDGVTRSPKFSCLRHFFMALDNPETGKPLIESVLPLPNRCGHVQVMYMDRHNNEMYIKRITTNPAAWWYNKWHSMGLTDDCVASLMDQFHMESRLVAHLSTFDSTTWVVNSTAS